MEMNHVSSVQFSSVQIGCTFPCFFFYLHTQIYLGSLPTYSVQPRHIRPWAFVHTLNYHSALHRVPDPYKTLRSESHLIELR